MSCMCERSVSSLAGVLGTLRGRLHLVLLTTVAVIEAGNSTTDAKPYVLFSTQQSIYRHYLNDSNSYTEQILLPSSVGTLGLSYHLRLDSMFWANGEFFQPAIYSAHLNGSGERKIITSDISEPADLAVDWINDRLYWVDRSLRQIGEYDLTTEHRSVVLSTGQSGASRPSALALYPYPNYGWIYWSDGNRLEKASVTGDAHSILRSNLVCVNVLAIDYSSISIYWIDHCLYEIHSLRLDGDSTTHTFPFSTTIFFASGLTIHNNTFYWSEQNGVFKRRNTTGASVSTIYDVPRGTRATGVQLVHPSMQPQVRDFIEIIAPTNGSSSFQCSVECVYGTCIPPGLCACNAGWRGESCATDLDECDRQNGRCEILCLNDIGSFHCACPKGYMLRDDHVTCEDVNECSIGNGGCQQMCVNEPGTFMCSCFGGYLLNDDGVNCTRLIEVYHNISVDPTVVTMSSKTRVYPSTVVQHTNGSPSDSLSAIANQSSTTRIVFATADTFNTTIDEMILTTSTKRDVIKMSSYSSSGYLSNLMSSSLTGEKSASAIPTVSVIPTVIPLTLLSTHTLLSSTSGISQPTAVSRSLTTSVYIPQSIEVAGMVTSSPGIDKDRKIHPSLSTSLLEPLTSTPPIHQGSSQLSSKHSVKATMTPPDVEVDVASVRGESSGERVVIIVTVSVLLTVSLVITAVVLLVIILAFRRRHKVGSYTPDRNHNTTMNFNLSVKRITNILSYTTKT